MGLVDKLVPEPSEGEIAEAVRAALQGRGRGRRHRHSGHGRQRRRTTRRRYFRILQRLARNGELTCRIDVRWPIAQRKESSNAGCWPNFGDHYVRIGGVKGFMDGSLGSSTAKMFDGYADNPANKGVFLFVTKGSMQSQIQSADAGGLSVAVHAIGDEANAVLLDMFDDAAKANGSKRLALPHRTRPAPAAAGLPAVQATRGDRVDAAVPRHRRRPLGRGADRPGAVPVVVRLPVAAGRRGGAGVRVGLAGGPAGPAARHRRRGQPPDARRQAPRRLVPRAADHRRGGGARRTRWGSAYAGVPGEREGDASRPASWRTWSCSAATSSTRRRRTGSPRRRWT